MVAAQGAPNSDINVTPLVDVVLVLLIIFMVVTPLLEKEIVVQVPETDQQDQPDEVPTDQLTVEVDSHGDYLVQVGATRPMKVSETDLLDRIRGELGKRKKKADKVVFFLANDKAAYGKLVSALDITRKADPEVTMGVATEDLPPGAPAPGDELMPGSPGGATPTNAPPPAPTP